MVSREEVLVTAVVRSLVSNLGCGERRIKQTETFRHMELDETDMTYLECAIEVHLHKTLMTGISLDDSIRSVVYRLQASI